MPYEREDGDVTLWPKRSNAHPKAPVWKGTLLWKGEEIEIAVWDAVSKKTGLKFLSGKASVKQANEELPGGGPKID